MERIFSEDALKVISIAKLRCKDQDKMIALHKQLRETLDCSTAEMLILSTFYVHGIISEILEKTGEKENGLNSLLTSMIIKEMLGGDNANTN